MYVRSSSLHSQHMVYLGRHTEPIGGPDGFIDTKDMLELCGDRYYFVGRRDGVINIGGMKVYPEEVEAVINRHPGVQMSLVKAKKSPITGSVVIAEVVLKQDHAFSGQAASAIQDDILLLCRESLVAYKVPAAVHIVPALDVADSGKVVRRSA